jgi:histidine triad (HIT) family protein
VGRCTFCDIAGSSLPADVVLDEGGVVAFLDHRPLFPGHVLVIPRHHVTTLADLPDGLIEPLFGAVRRVSGAVERALEAEGTFVAANNRVSQSVPHLHVHVVPRRRGDGLKGFFWPRHPYRGDEHRREVAAAIRSALG